MTPERWQQIEELFHSVAARPAVERTAFLDRACTGDAELRAEVERLLASHDEAGSFIKAPAFEVAAGMIADRGSQSMVAQTIGQTIGPYKILSLIGAGGMGEVYLAQDTRMSRDVALKLLPAHLTREAQRVARFQNEARALLALNHPNIVTIYEIGEVDGVEFIASEFIRGETVRERLTRLPLNLSEALDVATQVAGALAEAHAAGIIHRDIKPENIMLRRDGYVKVVDFGLAKLMEQEIRQVDAQAATRLLVETKPGLVMGTAAYMSPEQARGTTVDERSDIWSLGVVLFEMVSGRVPFGGDTTSDVIAAILQNEPPRLSRYVRETPEALEWLVSKALAKDRAERYQTARELLVDLRRLKQGLELAREMERSGLPQSSVVATSKSAELPVDTADNPESKRHQSSEAHRVSSAEYVVSEIKRHRAGAIIALICICVVIASAVYALRLWLLRNAPSGEHKPISSLSLKSVSTFPGSHRAASFSPDGNSIVFINQVNQVSQVWVKNLSHGDPVQITFDTEQADRPRWSPQNDQVVYVRGSPKTSSIWSVSPEGGTPRKVIEGGRNPNWSGDGGRLVFERGYDVWTANADGSDQRKLEGVPPTDLLIADRMPAFSPDGSLIAFFQKDKGPIGDYWVIPATGGPAHQLTFDSIHGGAPVWTSDSRFIIFPSKRSGSLTLWKVPAAGGQPEPVLVSAGEDTEPEISRDGHKLIYTNARNSFVLKLTDSATLVSRELKESPTDIFDPSFSPRGDKVLFFAFASEGEIQLFICNVDGGDLTQLTRGKGERNIHPHWSADGSFVYFYQIRPTTSFRRISSSGGASTELVAGWEWGTNNGARVDPTGKQVIYSKLDKGAEVATMIRDLETGKETAFTTALAHPLWSHNGDFVAGANESDVTICPVAGGDCRKLTKGHNPHWSIDDSNIYFWRQVRDALEIWSIPFAGGMEKKIADLRPVHPIGQFFDVSPKGQLVWVEYQRGRQELWLSDSFNP